MNITLIAPTYKRPEICNRLIKSVPDFINIVIVGLSDVTEIIKKENVYIHEAEQMPLTNALNIGVQICDAVFPKTEAYLLTDDDVYFTKETIIENNIFKLLKRIDTGIVAITRIINNRVPVNEHICSPFVYKGGGYFIRKDVFHYIGGYTNNNSVDEWDICIKTYINGYKNYRTKTCYAYHKQGTAKGGYWQAVKEGSNIGKDDKWLSNYIEYNIMKNSGYEYIAHSSVRIKPLAKDLHEKNNIILRG